MQCNIIQYNIILYHTICQIASRYVKNMEHPVQAARSIFWKFWEKTDGGLKVGILSRELKSRILRPRFPARKQFQQNISMGLLPDNLEVSFQCVDNDKTHAVTRGNFKLLKQKFWGLWGEFFCNIAWLLLAGSQSNRIKKNKTQYNIIQYNTIQCNTIVQCNIIQCKTI
jgi:hypothetical protein